MHGSRLLRAVPLLIGGLLAAQPAALPAVQEMTLPNGLRVLLVERPGAGMVHASLTFARPGSDPSGAPMVAFELLRRCLAASEGVGNPDLEGLLAREDGLWRSLRQPGASLQELQKLHADVRRELEGRLHGQPRLPEATVSALSADDLHLGWDLSVDQLPDWSTRTTRRLQDMTLAAFPEARDRWLEALASPRMEALPWPRAFGLLLPAALGGSNYGTAAFFSRDAAAEVRWEALRALGRSLASPDQMTVTLVGEVTRESVLPLLVRTLGTLPESVTRLGAAWPGVDAAEEGWTGRRLQAFRDGEPQVLLALRVPRAAQREQPALQVLAEVLAGGPSSRLWRRLVVELNLASRVSVHLGVPGVREAHLLVVEAEPVQGRTLQELEQGLQGELARLLREGVGREEVREAQLRVEAAETLIQDDAAALAQALGQARARTGQWVSAFPVLQGGPGLPDQGLHRLLRALAQPSGTLTLCLEPDALLTPQDPSEARLIRLLGERVGRAVQDPAALDAIVRQSVQQLRLLTPTERARLLGLLESEQR